MKVKDVMSSEVVTVGPDDGFKAIIELMRGRSVSSAPVVDREGRLLGIITEGDLIAKVAFPKHRGRRRTVDAIIDVIAGRDEAIRKAGSLTARDAMTQAVITAEPHEDVRAIARRMIDLGLKRLPVIEHERVVGMVSRADLLSAFDRSDVSIQAGLESLLQRCMYAAPDHAIEIAVREGIVELTGVVAFRSDVDVVGAIVGASEGVVGVANHLTYREDDPREVSG